MIDIKEQLIRHEGLNLSMYRCPADKWSIGVGHNLEDRPISKRAAMMILEDDIDVARRDLYRLIPEYADMPEPVAIVLVNLCFNMGAPRLAGFKKMLAAIRARHWSLAADELMDSRYAEQVGDRAVELAGILRSA
jgi:lysozyme